LQKFTPPIAISLVNDSFTNMLHIENDYILRIIPYFYQPDNQKLHKHGKVHTVVYRLSA